MSECILDLEDRLKIERKAWFPFTPFSGLFKLPKFELPKILEETNNLRNSILERVNRYIEDNELNPEDKIDEAIINEFAEKYVDLFKGRLRSTKKLVGYQIGSYLVSSTALLYGVYKLCTNPYWINLVENISK